MTFLSLLLFIILLIVNYVVYKKKKLSKSFFIITSIILLINSVLIYALYYNNISLGFLGGIIHGDLNGIYIDDEFKYFHESNVLSILLKENGLLAWITKTLPYNALPSDAIPGINFNPYGFYNPFVSLLALIRLLGFNNLTELLMLKLILVLVNSYLVFDISSRFCSKKLKYAPLIIFNLAPAYLLINATLSRDLLIITAVLYTFKFIITRDNNYKKLIIPFIVLLIFRSYVIVTLLGTIFFVFRNTKHLISKIDLLFIILVFIGVYLLQNVSIPISKVEILSIKLKELHGNSLFTPFNLTFKTIWDIFVKSPYLNLLKTNSIYSILISLSSLYYMLFSGIFIIKTLSYIISKKSREYNWIIKLTIYFTLLTSYILVMRDGFVTARITNMWFFLFIIIIFIPFENKIENKINNYFKKNTDS